MKKIFLMLFGFFSFIFMCNAQTLNELPNLERYAKANKELGLPKKGEKRVVLIGNSITEGWVGKHPDFFVNNNYVGRGIGGQTSPQLLMRFQQDVVSLKPVAVVINIGTNDIAENTGKYDLQFTLDNIKSMAEIAKANGIKVILSAVLPVGQYPWKKEIENVPDIISSLNNSIKEYAKEKKFAYIDYYTPMCEKNGSLIESLGYDGVHPNEEGYNVMEKIAKPIIDRVIK